MKRRPLITILLTFVAVGLAVVVLSILDVQLSHLSSIHDPADSNIPHEPVALILGASITTPNTPSDALKDRLLTGIALYRSHMVDKLLLSGDDGDFRSDEISVMKSFVFSHGVTNTADVLSDGKGYRTYESCKHAREVFHLDQAIVVTQRFHMGRALYLCDSFGVKTEGVTADLEGYRGIVYYWARDIVSSAEAWSDVNLIPPSPPVR